MPVYDPNVGIAFALVAAAGAATAIGAAVVFFPRLVRLASRKTLAASLGLSAGVMTYVSFVEIFQKSRTAFVHAEFPENQSTMYATACFFGGVVLMVVLNYIVTWLLGGHHHHHHHDGAAKVRTAAESHEESGAEPCEAKEEISAPVCPCCSHSPAEDLENYRNMAEEIAGYEEQQHQVWEGQEDTHSPDCSHHSCEPEDRKESESDKQQEDRSQKSLEEGQPSDDEGEHPPQNEETHKLMRMSVNTAVAIALHNFPEGLATFVSALADPGVGAVLAVAIAIHNIPEGLCVALPIYYATGKKWKAFWWACLSGISEPFAALLGWAVLANHFSNTTYGILFGVVAGMMVIISTKELLPTAHRYDTEDSVVTYSFIAGMAIMALSLVLFLL